MRSSKRLAPAIALLVLGLSLPIPAAARTGRLLGPNPTQVTQQEPSFLRLLWSALASLWGKEGTLIDPFG
jgi:hypothetical protein